METGPPPQKRLRTQPPPTPQWQQHHNGVHHSPQPPPNALPLPTPNQSRSLPPFSQPTSHQYGPSAYPNHPSPLPPIAGISSMERHHNDRPPYESVDLRRPSSGASHGYQPSPTALNSSQQSPYNLSRDPPGRNSMIKRDPSADESQYRGSPNTPSDQHGGHHLPPHEVTRGPYQPPHPQQPLPHYESQHIPPQPHRTNSFQSPSPMSAQGQYNAEPFQRPGHFQPQEPYVPAYPQQQGTPRVEVKPRKAQRAAQACDSCRTLKAKCDEGRPKCNSCVEKNCGCNYRDPPPKLQDKSNLDIAETLNRMEGIFSNVSWEALGRIPHSMENQGREISELRKEVERMKAFIIKDEPVRGVIPKQEEVKHESQEMYRQPTARSEIHISQEIPVYDRTPKLPHSHVSSKPLVDTAETGSQSPEGFNPPPHETGSDEDDGGPQPPRIPPTIPLNHTTEAANLLEKPGVTSLVKGIIGPGCAIKSVRYAAEQEKRRGQLKFFGRGEAVDYYPGYDRDSASDHLSGSTPGDNYSETSSPSGEYERDRGGILSPPNFSQEPVFEEISLERKLDLSEETVKSLIQSYKDHINNMHPILTFSQIDRMVQFFLKTNARSRPNPTSNPNPTAAFAGSTAWDLDSPGSKRKRSPAGEPHDVPKVISQTRFDYPSRPIDRSVNTGLVLLMMALGKVCLRTTKLPDVTTLWTAENLRTSSPLVRNGYPNSPVQNSPSTADFNHRSRRQSTEGIYSKLDLSKMNNMDLVPGLDYFSYATDVIGNQLGGNRLQHVHLGLLAGLYHGQLGRVVDSHAYIFQASRCLQEVLKKKLDKLRRVKEGTNNGIVDARDNPLVFAFWTTLQLESDIVAEMPLEQSGILNLEEYMPGPNLKVAEEADKFDPFILESYMAQLFLRKHLNKIHGLLYRPEESEKEKKEAHSTSTIDALHKGIAINLKWAPRMMWKDHLGERSDNILHARLRAKWYGACVITFRQYILDILDASAKLQQREAQQQWPQREEFGSTSDNPPEYLNSVGKPILTVDATGSWVIGPEAREYAKQALLALIHSTSAFHDVADPGSQRLIVTNIWGTAHAQWGNLVTLQAAYNNHFLHPLVLDVITHEQLSLLLGKTIAFLNFNGTKNSALRSDSLILRHMGRTVGLIAGSAKQTPQDRNETSYSSSSFHSVTSTDGGRGDVAMSGSSNYHT